MKPPAADKWRALLPILGAVAYGASPLDVVPDLIPLLGLTDDAGFAVLMVVWAIRLWRKRPSTRTPQLQPR